MLPLILVVAAEHVACEPFRRELNASGFKAYYVQTQTAALAVLAQWNFDGVLVHGRGWEGATTHVLRALRAAAETPILLVVDRADEEAQLLALEAGAGQVLVEPTSVRIVAAQLRRLIELAQQRPKHEGAEVRFGPLRLDPRRATATIGDAPIALTAGEFELLLLLASHAGELIHRDTIARTLGRTAASETRRSADMHICRIRRKLRDVGGHALQVETVYGRGYLLRLAPPDDEAEDARLAEWSV